MMKLILPDDNITVENVMVALDNIYDRLQKLEKLSRSVRFSYDSKVEKFIDDYAFVKRRLLPAKGYLNALPTSEYNYKLIILSNYRLILSIDKHIDELYILINVIIENERQIIKDLGQKLSEDI